MKNLFNFLFVTILALSFASCSTYQYELGSMSTQDQAEKIALLNKQEKRQLQMEKAQSRKGDSDQDDLLSGADKNSLLRIKESRSGVIEDMAQQDQKSSIRVKSRDGYEAAYFYQAVNAGSVDVRGKESSQMNLLLINSTKKRHSYTSTDPYSVTAIVSLVEPKEKKPGFSLKSSVKKMQVAAVVLSAEGKKNIQLPIGFYRVDFVYNGKIVYSEPVTLSPLYKVIVSAEDVRGTNLSIEDVNGRVFVEL